MLGQQRPPLERLLRCIMFGFVNSARGEWSALGWTDRISEPGSLHTRPAWLFRGCPRTRAGGSPAKSSPKHFSQTESIVPYMTTLNSCPCGMELRVP